MITLLIIYCIIGMIAGLMMYGIGLAGGCTPIWQKIVGVFVFPLVGQLWGPYILWVIIGTMLGG